MSFPGYVLKGAQDNFYYMSLSRHHPQRNCATRRLSDLEKKRASPCINGVGVEEFMLECEVEAAVADSEVRHSICICYHKKQIQEI